MNRDLVIYFGKIDKRFYSVFLLPRQCCSDIDTATMKQSQACQKLFIIPLKVFPLIFFLFCSMFRERHKLIILVAVQLS